MWFTPGDQGGLISWKFLMLLKLYHYSSIYIYWINSIRKKCHEFSRYCEISSLMCINFIIFNSATLNKIFLFARVYLSKRNLRENYFQSHFNSLNYYSRVIFDLRTIIFSLIGTPSAQFRLSRGAFVSPLNKKTASSGSAGVEQLSRDIAAATFRAF